ncbi:CLUMA_CG018160, isoform A [Clunio marinus]|uniref:CLUMA_CG018160, isoform A n=1 Tax=Clunio marinus TaxID=568069 RepID=A0A1J1J0U6_9DIPT|nr:CLUMA_CG018160, isoform A [Clunio marinus]
MSPHNKTSYLKCKVLILSGNIDKTEKSASVLHVIFAAVLLGCLSVGIYFLLTNEIKTTGAVATSNVECTKIGVDILKKGGSAVDSVVAATLCQGVALPQSSGLGGGFIAVIYTKDSGMIETLNAREVAPLAATKDMFPDNISSLQGGLAIAVPGELKGLFELHKKYGKLSWKEVVEATIEVAENGYEVTEFLSSIFDERGEVIKSKPAFLNYYTNPTTGEFYKKGELIRNPKLANTLRIIAEEGADAIYGNGSLAQNIVKEIQDEGGIITMEDLLTFEPKWGKPVISKLFNEDTIYSFPLPGSGSIVAFILNVLQGFNFQDNPLEYHNENKLFYHRLVEALKFAFGKRTKLGDEMSAEVLSTLDELQSIEHAEYIRSLIDDEKTFNDYEHYGANYSVIEDHGTGHISILAPNGDAVAITSTINYIFGSYVMSESSGIIYNNEMNDFSIPAAVSDGLLPAPANFIVPGKSPMSSMCPTVIVNNDNEVTMVVGGAGGILIMPSVVQFILRYLFFNESMDSSMNSKRIYHQLEPMEVVYEGEFDDEIVKFLESKQHKTYQQPNTVTGFANLVAITRRNGIIEAGVDPRRKGAKFSIF